MIVASINRESKYQNPKLLVNLLKGIIMQTVEIREKLHQYVDDGDDKLLKLMFALAKEYNDEEEFDYAFSPEDIREFDDRNRKYLSGESKAYTWEEAKDIITKKRKM